MAGTVTGTIGANAGVLFEYAGTTAALQLDIGFIPSYCEFRSSTTSLAWFWNRALSFAHVATASTWAAGAVGLGQLIGTTQSVASISGIQIGTDTTINAAVVYRGMCWR